MNSTYPVSKSRRGSNGKERNGKNGKQGQDEHSALYSLPALYRGLYNRVAERVGCDPSYVSRVARGERTSEEVARALETEIRQTLAVTSRQLSREGAARSARTSRS
jgi:transcriptional regulator with XRE-family HTH domain